MKLDDLIHAIERHRTQFNIYLVLAIVLLIGGVYILVHMTGGIKYVFSHTMYLPIVLAAITFGVRGGILAALVGGLLLGPFMAIDTFTGEQQTTGNWLYRVGFFTILGLLVGATSDIVAVYLNRMRWNASHDSMTGLPNNYALETTIKGLAGTKKNGEIPYLLIARLNNQVEIEASFGVEGVNVIIAQLADRIRARLQDSPEIYRTGTERFGFVEAAEDEHAVTKLTYELWQAFIEPVEFSGFRLHADVYLGFIALIDGSREPQLYIQRASHAAFEASKNRRRSGFLASLNDETGIAENLRLLGELDESLRSGQVLMHYQPKVEARTGKIDSVEALMRWQHPTHGNIPAGKFIPYAENSTLIDQLTHFAIDQSLAQLVAWEKNGLDNIRVAVNISTRNLLNPDFYKDVVQLLEFYGVDGERLELEVTESSFMEDMESSIAELTKFTQVGITLSIDDFGTGYSSLQYLEKMPVSVIKIDQGFIRLLPGEPGSRNIVEAAIGLAHSLGLKVVAEGVESRATYDFLMHAGCDLIQGYFVGRPIGANELEETCKVSKGILVHV